MGNQPSSSETFGYRVLGIQSKSPAESVGLVPFFDFIVSANGIRLDERDSTFMDLISVSEDKPLPLTIYNVKRQKQRDVVLTPTRKWPGQGMLGVTIRFDSFEDADTQIIHVLDITKRSPADLAGLKPNEDFILGVAERAFSDVDDFFEEIQRHIDKPLDIYVYSSQTDKVRLVTILPNLNWGGESLLGAEVGFGILHRLPESCRETNGATAGPVFTHRTTTPVGPDDPPPPYPKDPVGDAPSNIKLLKHDIRENEKPLLAPSFEGQNLPVAAIGLASSNDVEREKDKNEDADHSPYVSSRSEHLSPSENSSIVEAVVLSDKTMSQTGVQVSESSISGKS